MAARINKKHSDETRSKIQASVLIDRFHKSFMGKIELTDSQIKSGIALLDRSVPKLSQIQHSGDEQSPLVHKVIREIVRTKN